MLTATETITRGLETSASFYHHYHHFINSLGVFNSECVACSITKPVYISPVGSKPTNFIAYLLPALYHRELNFLINYLVFTRLPAGMRGTLAQCVGSQLCTYMRVLCVCMTGGCLIYEWFMQNLSTARIFTASFLRKVFAGEKISEFPKFS